MDYSGAKPGGLNPNEKAALMTNIKHQLEVAQATELLQTITEKCFKMCVQKPGSSLGGSEQVSIYSLFHCSPKLIYHLKLIIKFRNASLIA